MKEYNFDALIKASVIGKGGAYIEFPYNVEKEFGVKGRVKVICYFEGIEYKGSLVKMGTDCHIIGILKEIRQKLNKKIGDVVSVKIIKDESERVVEENQALKSKLDENPMLRQKYELFSFTKKKEINDLLNSAKKEETFNRRFEKIIDDLSKK